MGGLICPPWHTKNRALASKLARNRRLKAKGLTLPASKAEQRALAQALDRRNPGALSD